MASNGENAIFMEIIEDSSVRQLWRLTNVLIKVRSGALTQRDVKSEGRPGYVYENKGHDDKIAYNLAGFVPDNAQIAR